MSDHDGVTPLDRCRIQQSPNQLSPRFFFQAGKFVKNRKVLRRCSFAEGKLPGVNASAIRAGQYRADRNPQALERRADVSGFTSSPFIEISLARAISIVVSALPRNKALGRHMAHQDDEPPFSERLDELPPLQQRLERLALRVRLALGKQQNHNRSCCQGA